MNNSFRSRKITSNNSYLLKGVIIQMMEKQKGGRYLMFKVAILSLSLILPSVGVMGAVVSKLAEDFPNASRLMLQGFVNIPVLGGMAATLLGGILAPKIGKKNLCLLGSLLCFVGGILPMFIPTLVGKIIVRVIAGIGVGLLQPLSASLIVDCFEGQEANNMMGIQSSCVGLGATIMSSSIAAIMTYDWHKVYSIYFLALIVFFLVLAYIPNSVNNIGRETKNQVSKSKTKMPLSAYFGLIIQIIYASGYGFLSVNLSLGAVETGTITAVQAATAMSIGSIAAMLGGLIFGTIKSIIDMRVCIVSLVMQTIGFFLLANTSSPYIWYVANAIIGVGFCWFMPYVNFLVNEHTDPSISAQATSYAFFGNSVGSFIAPYVFATIGAVTGITSCWKSFNIAAIIMIICAALIIVFTTVESKSKGMVENYE